MPIKKQDGYHMEELIETLKSCGYDAFFVKTKEEA